MKIETIKLTKLEQEIVNGIAYSDHSSDGYGLAGYLDHRDYDMKVMRGVMASLTNKGVATFQAQEDNSNLTWAYISENLQENVIKDFSYYEIDELLVKQNIDLNKYNKDEIELIKCTGYRLIGLEEVK